MQITTDDLIAISPYCRAHAAMYIEPLNAAMQEFGITQPLDCAAFLATVLHESGSLQYTRELASGDAYEFRKDLGNTRPGWGRLYKGAGLIQVTGYWNFCIMEAALKIPCTAHPELLAEPVNACRSAAYFWSSHGLSVIANKGDFLTVSIRVNGKNKQTGLPNGWPDRQALYEKAKERFKC